MLMVLRWYSMGLAVMILAVAGCEGQQREFEEAPAASQRTANAPPAAEVPTTPGMRALPDVLERAEDISEDVQEDIAEGDWEDAAKKTNQLQALADSIRQTGAPAAEVSAYDSAVAELAREVQSRDQVGAGLAANSANRAVLSMMSAYQVEVPVEVGYMEVDVRDVVYHAAADQWGEAEKAVEDMKSNYAKVQAHVAQKDSGLDNKIRAEIAQLGTTVAQKNAAATNAAAKKVNDLIDDVEDTY